MIGTNQATLLGLPQDGGGYGSEVSLLMHFDGSDGGTTFTDSSSYAHTVTPNGAVTTSTTSPKFGTAAGSFGAAGYLQIPNDTSFQLSTGDFSIDFWVKPTNFTYVAVPFRKGTGSTIYQFYLNSGTGNANLFLNGAHLYTGQSWGITAGSWQHIEISRTSGVIYSFLGGVLKRSDAFTSNLDGGTTDLYIGKDQATSYLQDKRLDELRILKGVGGHTTNFTPPTAPY